MIKPLYTVLLGSFLLLFASCSREDSLDVIPDNTIQLGLSETTNTIVIKVEEEGTALANVAVSNFNTGKTSDENGVVMFRNATRNEVGYSVSVEKDGYYDQSIFIEYDAEVNNIYKTVQLQPKGTSTKLTSTGNGTISELIFGTTLSVLNGTFESESGALVTEGVEIFADVQPIDASTVVSQALFFYDADLNREIMMPTHKISIFAEGPNGEELSIAAGSTLNIQLALTPGIIGDTMTISGQGLLSPTAGILEKQDVFSKQEDMVVGALQHLGTYYLGRYREVKESTVLIKNVEGTKLAFTEVDIEFPFFKIRSWTDQNGALHLDLPADKDVTLNVLPRELDSEIPYDAGSADEQPLVETIEAVVFDIVGTYTDCTSDTDKDGYVLSDRGVVAIVQRDGQITGTYVQGTAPAEQQFTVVSATNAAATAALNPLNGLVVNVNLGDVEVCATGSSSTKELRGFVRYDSNDNGIADSVTELPGLLDGQVYLYDADGILLESTTIDEEGGYTFGQIPVGTNYEVEIAFADEEIAQGYWVYGALYFQLSYRTPAQLRAFQRVVDFTSDVIVVIGIARDGEGSISGFVSRDANGDGNADLPEAGQLIVLQQNLNIADNSQLPYSYLDTTHTDASGYYEFTNVASRRYVVQLGVDPTTIAISEGDEDGDTPDDADSVVNGEIPVYLQLDEVDENNNFVIEKTISPDNYGSASGTVMLDTDGDDIGDEPYEGEILLIHKRGANGFPVSTGLPDYDVASDAEGKFIFTGLLPGEYVIQSTGFFPDTNGSFANFDRILDKDETPEADEPIDNGEPDMWIWVDIKAGAEDTDNNIVVRIN